MLHITNGDAANEMLRRANIPGEMLAWSDCLHEGPVPGKLDLAALSRVRADYLSNRHGLEPVSTHSIFEQRDRELADFRQHDEVVLWCSFELYDQLHLLQLLDWFSGQDLAATRLSVVFIDAYLGMDHEDRPRQWLANRREVDATLFALGNRGWTAFRSDTPEKLVDLAGRETGAAPFLQTALYRLLEELPTPNRGLSRTERQILISVDRGVTALKKLFRSVQQMENPAFMGDSSFWVIVSDLCRGPNPALTSRPGRSFLFPDKKEELFSGKNFQISLTATGRRILDGDEDLVSSNGIERWLGGTHLCGSEVWRWDPAAKICSRR